MQTLEPETRKELLTFLRREYQARSALLFRDPAALETEGGDVAINRQAMFLRISIGFVFDFVGTQPNVLQMPKWVIEKFRHDLILEEGGEWRLLDPRHAGVPKEEMWKTLFAWEAALARAFGASSFPPRP